MAVGETTHMLSNAQRRLNQITIRFVGTTFTYGDFVGSSTTRENSRGPSRTSGNRQSFVDRAKAKIRDKTEIVTRNTGQVLISGNVPQKRLQNCIFPGTPGDEKTRVKNYIAKFPSKPKLSFIDCNFVNRNPTLWERMVRWIIDNLCGGGTTFTLCERGESSAVEVEGGTFVLSTIPNVTRNILSRIQEPDIFDL